MEVAMPALAALGFAAATPIRRALKAFGRTLARHAVRLDQALRNRQAARVLARFDDRMLADIGLNRSDLRDAYAQSLWRDPTDLLRVRALERRRKRRDVPAGAEFGHASAPPLVPKVDASAATQARATFCSCW
jgi:uncharacterized protein YjiS (DUF1127 family)